MQFSYTAAAGQNTTKLAATAVNLNGATIKNGAGVAAGLSLSGLTQNGPKVDTIAPTIIAIGESPSTGDLHAGQTVTFTLSGQRSGLRRWGNADADFERRRRCDL